MLPTSSSFKARSGPHARPSSFLPQYLRRIVKNYEFPHPYEALMWPFTKFIKYSFPLCRQPWQQMDIEYTFWQMLHLCTSPKVVYQHTKYHKQMKNQWARDDPAFVVICSLLLSISTIAYCAAYDHSAGHTIFVVISVLLFHFLVTGAILATCCWFFTNNYLREEALNSHVVEQRVEWLYTFDVHCNSFFPMFVLLYVVHYFLSPVLVAHGFVPVLLSNVLFMAAASYYHYLNYLGYDVHHLPHMTGDAVLPFLERTTLFLYPIGVVLVLSPIYNSEWLQPVETCHEHLFQSIAIDVPSTTTTTSNYNYYIPKKEK
ncbi:hypothetical protein OROHE_024490 [Orobanche hederae]